MFLSPCRSLECSSTMHIFDIWLSVHGSTDHAAAMQLALSPGSWLTVIVQGPGIRRKHCMRMRKLSQPTDVNREISGFTCCFTCTALPAALPAQFCQWSLLFQERRRKALNGRIRYWEKALHGTSRDTCITMVQCDYPATPQQFWPSCSRQRPGECERAEVCII